MGAVDAAYPFAGGLDDGDAGYSGLQEGPCLLPVRAAHVI